MKPLVFAIFVFVVAAHGAAGAQLKPMTPTELAAYNKPDREKILYEGVKKEGRLMWYTSLTGGLNLEVPRAFANKYPGIKVDVYRGDSDAIIQRVLQEAQGKRFLVDIIETTFPILKVMQEYKLLLSPICSEIPPDPYGLQEAKNSPVAELRVTPTVSSLCVTTLLPF